MINQQLLEYVRAQRGAGLSKEAIIQALAAGGWTQNDVEQAWAAIDGVRTAPPPPPPPPPVMQNPPRTIVPPPGAKTPAGTIPSMAGMAPTPAVAPRPMVASSEFSTAVVKKRRSWPWILLIILFLIVIAGGIYYATFLNPGVIALPKF